MLSTINSEEEKIYNISLVRGIAYLHICGVQRDLVVYRIKCFV